MCCFTKDCNLNWALTETLYWWKELEKKALIGSMQLTEILFEKTIFTPSTHGQACTPTSDECKIFGFREVVINVFSIQFGISGFRETWVMPDELRREEPFNVFFLLWFKAF